MKYPSKKFLIYIYIYILQHDIVLKSLIGIIFFEKI